MVVSFPYRRSQRPRLVAPGWWCDTIVFCRNYKTKTVTVWAQETFAPPSGVILVGCGQRLLALSSEAWANDDATSAPSPVDGGHGMGGVTGTGGGADGGGFIQFRQVCRR